jgi:hypothetical protein
MVSSHGTWGATCDTIISQWGRHLCNAPMDGDPTEPVLEEKQQRLAYREYPVLRSPREAGSQDVSHQTRHIPEMSVVPHILLHLSVNSYATNIR